MKILHSADIHLKEYRDDRWKTMEKLIEIGKKEEIDVFVISGDLFDQKINAENLRPKIREIFSNNGFNIVLIPGNHDCDCYKTGMFFGDDTEILTNLEESFEYENVVFWGFPFESISEDNIFEKLCSLKSKLDTRKTNILLYHGELIDTFFSRRDFGDEGGERYMPCKLSYFNDLNFDYVLAGHFHSRFDVWEFTDGRYFVYPGSPIAITKRERGIRNVNIFEIGKSPEQYPIESPFYEEITMEFDPFEDDNPLEEVKNQIKDIPSFASIILTITGFINGEKIGINENDLIKQIKHIIRGKCAEEDFNPEFKDITIILENDLFKTFIDNLNQRHWEEEKKINIRNLVIKAMMGVAS